MFGNLLGYGTLGWAWSTTNYSFGGASSGQTVKGVVFGVGVEYPITRNVSIRGELLRYDFGGATYTCPGLVDVDDHLDQRRAHRREPPLLKTPPSRRAVSRRSGRDGAGRRRPARKRPSPRRPARRECRRTGRGVPW